MTQRKESVEFNGITFTRYPDSPARHSRVYYWPYVGSKRAPGVQALHVEIWKSAHGPVPKGFQVHYKDGDPLNNDIGNLECLSPKEHSARHASEFADFRRANIKAVGHLATGWHRSEEGRAWHSEHGKQTWDSRERKTRICSECGSVHESFTPADKLGFCSRACISRHNERTKRYYEDRACAVCGSVFNVKKSKKQRTCSRKCGVVLRRSGAT